MRAILPLVCTLVIFEAGCHCAKRMTLADAHSKDDYAAYSETPQARAEISEGGKLVEDFKRTFPSKDCEHLIAVLTTHSPSSFISVDGPRYYFLREGNKAIIAELKARGEAARPALLRHIDDQRLIWDGDNGLDLAVGFMCKTLLEELDIKKTPNQALLPTPMSVTRMALR